jgi:hypothetical protein
MRKEISGRPRVEYGHVSGLAPLFAEDCLLELTPALSRHPVLTQEILDLLELDTRH